MLRPSPNHGTQWLPNDDDNMLMSGTKPPPLKKLPLTDSNLQLHVLRAHLQMMLWKAAYQKHPPVDARNNRFVWEGGVVTPYVSNAPVVPQGLLDVVSCSCSAEREDVQLSQYWTFNYGALLL